MTLVLPAPSSVKVMPMLPRPSADTVDRVAFVVTIAALLWLGYRGAGAMGYNWQWYRVPDVFVRVIDGEIIPGPLLRGLGVTLRIAAVSTVLALVVGLATALLRLSGSFSGRVLATIYLEAIRNTPMLVQIFVGYFVLAPILGIDRFWVGVLCLGLFEGAFASEVIRGGIRSVASGQWEAARALGLAPAQIVRLVILPQAIPIMVPPLAGILVNLVKHSAIVSVIAVFDLTNEARNVIADTFLSFEIWLAVAATYLALTIPLSGLMGLLERRFRARS